MTLIIQEDICEKPSSGPLQSGTKTLKRTLLSDTHYFVNQFQNKRDEVNS